MKTSESENIVCWNCGTPFEWIQQDPSQPKPELCDPCTAIKIEQSFQAARKRITEKVLALTPDRYRETDTGHPAFNRPLWDHVKTWLPSPDHPWLGIVGPTGECKSRCSYLLFREICTGMVRPARFHNSHPWIPSIAVVKAHKFTLAVADMFIDDSKDEAVEFLNRLRMADVLLMDDLGKQANTSRVSLELFDLLDTRHEGNLTTIWTANLSPEGIVARMPDDLAAPLAGRIRECSTIINLQ